MCNASIKVASATPYLSNMFLSYVYIIVLAIHLLARTMAEQEMRASHCDILEVPWSVESVMTKKLFTDAAINGKQRFYKFDLWHCFHLGAGKHWCGCGLLLISQIVPGSNADARFAYISARYLAFCKEKRIPSVITKIDQHTCNAAGGEGTWNKAAVTSNMCLFLEAFCHEHAEKITGNKQLEYLEPLFQACIYFFMAKL